MEKWHRPALGIIVFALVVLRLTGFPSALHGRAEPDSEPQSAAFTLSGRVYEGTTGLEPPLSTPLQGVKVELWCSNNPYPGKGTLLDTQYTNSIGWYGLTVDRDACEYYHIIQTNLAGYVSDGATTVSGVVKTADWIQYQGPLAGKTLTGNKFWDKSQNTKTATPTATASKTRTPTATRTATRTGSATPTGTPYADVRISKGVYAPTGTVVPGATMTYQLAIGSQQLIQTNPPVFVVTDVLPSAVSYLGWTGGAATCSLVTSRPPNDIVRCTSDFGGSGLFFIYLDVRVDENACGLLHNHAEAYTKVYDPDLSNNTVDLYTQVGTCVTPSPTSTRTRTPTRGPTVSPTPTATTTSRVTNTPTATPGVVDLAIFKWTADASGHAVSVKPGDTFWYNGYLTLHPGAILSTVVVSDTLPPGLAVVQVPDYCAAVPQGPSTVIRCQSPPYPNLVGGWVFPIVEVKLDEDACGPITNTVTVGSDMPDPDPSNNTFQLVTMVEPCPPADIRVIKTLVDPPGGTANVGDIVRFRIDVHNTSQSPTVVDLEDVFLDDEFDFVASTPPPTTSTSDGTNHFLLWENLPVPPAGFTVFVDLKTKMPGVSAQNCAHYIPEGPTPPGIAATGPLSCATVRVEALEGRHFAIYKKFITPSNHIAQLGDWLSFETQWLNTGTERAVEVRLHDYMTPASGLSLPLSFGVLWPFDTGDWAKLSASFKSQDVASPAINTAYWTATWPDGTKTTASASDYVYILRGPQGKGLFTNKELVAPAGGAVVSDTVHFRITITNVTGADLPVVSLTDTFPIPCLRFDHASVPPDSVTPGTLTWNNIGPLPLGAHRTIDVFFHAEAVCPAAMNCASTQYQSPTGQPMYSVDCADVTIRGPQPHLTVRKRLASPNPTFLGSLVIWEIAVTNDGQVPLPVVPLHDGYQVAYFDFDSATPGPDALDLVHGRLDWNNIGPLDPGQTRTVILRLIAKAPHLGALNCAESRYTVGSSTFAPSDCATVDIITELPSISIQKERTGTGANPDPTAPVAVGDTVAFKVTVQNTGMAPLFNVVVQDHYDPDCMQFVNAPLATYVSPGLLRWDLSTLAVGESRSWDVVFWVTAPCNPIPNCVVADGAGPEGHLVHDETCVEFAVAPPEPGIAITKRLAAPEAQPLVGNVMLFEIIVQNTGNATLNIVPVDDTWDPACLEYAHAYPWADAIDPLASRLYWNNVGPLPPGGSVVLSVFLHGRDVCGWTLNCARAVWLVDGTPQLDAMDCAGIGVSPGIPKLYLPIVMKQYLAPGPTYTPTRTATRTATLTPTRTRTPTPSPATRTPTRTPTLSAASATPTRTRTPSAGGVIFSDDFNDGDLAGWTSTLGTWTNPNTYLRGEYATDNAWNMRAESGGNFEYEGTVNLLSGNAVGLTFRSSADGSSSYDAILDAVDGVFKLSRRSPYVVLQSYSMTVQRNHQYRIKVVASGSTIEAYLDGVKRLTVTDSAYATGQFGVMLYKSTAAYDNLEAWSIP